MIFEIRQIIKKVLNRIDPMCESVYQAYIGMRLISKIRKQYGSNTHIFFMRGATGDTYIQLLLINNWLREKKCEIYVLVGDAQGIRKLKDIFDLEFISISKYRADCIEKIYMLLGEEKLNLTVMFLWTSSLYFNRCRIRMIERFNFMDTYRWYVLGLKEPIKLNMPVFPEIADIFFEKKLKKGKTVIVAPEANSVTQLSCDFWNEIIDILEKMGYKVLINSEDQQSYNAQKIFFEYRESKSLLEYAGFFLGIRSGLCDIISSVKCKKVIIYPEKSAIVNYSEHRSEIEFCGIQIMGLSDDDDELIEIETPLIRNITQKESEILSKEDYIVEKEKLKAKVLSCF